MNKSTEKQSAVDINLVIDDILAEITQEREQEIISRRFGLKSHRETLEQIGEMLGVTRERVRQLEKAILIRLKSRIIDNSIQSASAMEKMMVSTLSEMGRAAKTKELASKLLGHKASKLEIAQITFLTELMPSIVTINENDDFYQSAILSSIGDEKSIKQQITDIVKFIKKNGKPITAKEMHAEMKYEHPSNIAALAGLSKKLTSLKENWGLVKWPAVNPKNIRDKIFVILKDIGKPVHFSVIAKAIEDSEFKRKDVTKQAIHNELIKDQRFVLIGRGIYALEKWGFSSGTVADIIREVLQEAEAPLHRDEIVMRVLKKRQVKETTVLLNLQSKPQFVRTAKATYTYQAPAK